MKRSNWAEWAKPDLDGLAALDAEKLPFQGYTRRSIIPDPLSVLIAAESGKPILYPVFPINGFTPENGCDAHKGPIPEGSSAYCPGCHDTGLRDHRALKLDPATMPAPEPDPSQTLPEADSRPDAPLTRKQRRARKYHVGPSASTTGTPDSHAATATP